MGAQRQFCFSMSRASEGPNGFLGPCGIWGFRGFSLVPLHRRVYRAVQPGPNHAVSQSASCFGPPFVNDCPFPSTSMTVHHIWFNGHLMVKFMVQKLNLTSPWRCIRLWVFDTSLDPIREQLVACNAISEMMHSLYSPMGDGPGAGVGLAICTGHLFRVGRLSQQTTL